MKAFIDKLRNYLFLLRPGVFAPFLFPDTDRIDRCWL